MITKEFINKMIQVTIDNYQEGIKELEIKQKEDPAYGVVVIFYKGFIKQLNTLKEAISAF